MEITKSMSRDTVRIGQREIPILYKGDEIPLNYREQDFTQYSFDACEPIEMEEPLTLIFKYVGDYTISIEGVVVSIYTRLGGGFSTYTMQQTEKPVIKTRG